MANLRHLTLWGATAAVALFIAVLAARSNAGSQRVALALASLRLDRPTPHTDQPTTRVASRTEAAPNSATSIAAKTAKLDKDQSIQHSFDAEAAARQLAHAVHGLAEDRDRLAARLAAVERNVGDITGSISRQMAAGKARSPQAAPWPDARAPAAATPATIAAVVAPVVPSPPGLSSPLPLPPPQLMAEPMAPAAPAREYGIDLGTGLSAAVLRARWAGIRSAHGQLFTDLRPKAAVRKALPGHYVLRLVVGPLESRAKAEQLCVALAAFRLYCRPTLFNGRSLALQ